MIRKLKSGQYRLYSRKTNPRTGRRRNLGTFSSRAAAEKCNISSGIEADGQKPTAVPCRSYSSARSILTVVISPTRSGRLLFT
jgi:hypothetical protein